MTDAAVVVRSRRSLSPMQRPLYASQQRHPRAPLQNMVALAHIDGPVDPERLAHAFATVVAASDVLRTQIRMEGDGETVVRLASEPAETEILRVDRADARSWAEARAREMMPLAERCHDSVVLVHEDGTASWYLALHHCVTDATSSTMVFRLTADAYEGRAVELDSYYDRVDRLTESGPARERAERHWAERAPAPRIGHLYERHLPATPSSTRLPVAIDDDLVAALDGLLAGEFRSLNDDLSWTAALLTATAAHLHRLTGASAFALGLPVHNRSHPDARELVGPLVEVFPVDVTVEPNDTFVTLHRRMSRSLSRTLRHAHPGTAPAGGDIEAVVNIVPDGDVAAFGPFPADYGYVHADASDANHLLRVQLIRFGRLELVLDVNDAALSVERRNRAADHFATVLRHMATMPDQPIGGFSLLAEDEARTAAEWGEGPAAPVLVHTIERLAEALGASDRIALVDGDRSWSGAELWRGVVELAADLRARGVGPGVRVAIEMERSAEAVIAILAVMAAGGSYVPIDPAQPALRRARLIERASCLLTLRSLSLERPDVSSELVDPTSIDDEAYLLFTSGSTGEPKGVPITHRGLAGYLAFAEASYVRNEPPVVPLFSALTFDLTVTSLYLPLLTGGRLVVIRGDGPDAIRDVARRTELTWCKATPSHLEMLVRLIPTDHSLATLVVGGEAFGTALARRLVERRQGLRIFNEYGPTEAVVGCMIHEYDPDEFPGCPDVPIGRPAPGVRLRVLDGGGNPAPAGTVGELHIASPGLTDGYLDGDTSAFVELEGHRWYRSGDLVRMLDDHTLVYLRRADEQLKVGGIRLDPSEIEAALVEHPAVRRAAVRAWSPTHQEPTQHCGRCGLADNVPGVEFDAEGVCDRCHAYDAVRDRAEAWFKTPADLVALRDRARETRTGDVDCVALLSGGKDSTYALFQLVGMGFAVHALTLDNGFISEEAKANARRSVEALGISHEFATTEAMSAIFRDSLERHSNVCHGCFKTIYTLATNRAVDLGAPLVVTGLSRGQLFETRLIPGQFSEERFDPDAIDAAVVAARKAYHRADDAVTRLLDTEVFADDGLFDRIHFVDFYRYVDVELSELLRFLDEEAPWIRPSDTGRSTNCRINAAGIQTHLEEQGYHNYAEPYAWDVRLGHKQRDEALAELDDRDDADEVAAMLAEVGYRPHRRETLTAWVEPVPGTPPPSPAELRVHLQNLLPAHAVPSAFVVIDELPMTANGKLDDDALPAPDRTHRSSPALVLEPTSALERTIVELWERQLGVEPISVDDDFFALGGDSLAALEMTMLLSDELGTEVPDEVAFANANPRALALAVAEHLDHTGAAIRSAPERGGGGDPPRLSAAEQSMLFEHRLRPEDPRYNVGRLFRFDGPADSTRLRRAAETVVSRHQPLHWTYSTPRRRLDPAQTLAFETVPVAGWAEAEAAASRLHRRPFDLVDGPLVRLSVYDVGGEATGVALITHHISTDATCFERLWRELEALYHGDDLAPLEISYADHTSWQSATATTEDAVYWRGAIGRIPRLALHRPQPAAPDGVRERVAELTTDELRSASGTAPFVGVLSALGTVMRRMTGSDEVTVGALVSTRDHQLANDLVGYYLNTLPLTIDVRPHQTFAELRSSAGNRFAQGMAHRAHPFAEMVADARRTGSPDPSPQVLVAMEDMDNLSFGRHQVSQEVLLTGSAVADLTVIVQLRDGEVVLVVEHRGSLMGAAAADRFLADLDTALTAALRHPDLCVGDCRFRSQDASLLVGPPPAPTNHVVEQIVRRVAERGDQVAVCAGGKSLSWSALGQWSGNVAERLVAEGVRPGDRVLVSVPRSVELVVAIVGVLRAGAAYVPVDPSYPSARNRVIAGAAGAAAVVASDVEPDLGVDATAIAVGREPDGLRPTTEDPLPTPDLDAPAYVVFTSGSTGEPRRVVVSHRELAASTAARDLAYPEPPERFLMMSSPAFDSSVAGLFWTLTTGGTIVLPTDGEVHDLDAVLDLVAEHRVTHTLVVPSLYRALLSRAGHDAPWPDRVVVAGEACAPDIVAAHFDSRPGNGLTNEYGPTEATVWATYEHLGVDTNDVPIGRPIAGAWSAVVDSEGELCPEGVVGELIIGGVTVTAGYDGQASDRFADSSVHGPGRVFRTGDLAAVVGGLLFFHGRRDDQLNVGGVRIEPAEVEAALEAVDGVRAAVVVVRDIRPLEERLGSAPVADLAEALRRAAADPDPAAALDRELVGRERLRLVAHLECAGVAPDEGTLRSHAAGALPPSSVPSAFVIHERLPRSPNGKIDRAAAAALPVPSRGPAVPVTTTSDDGLTELVALYRESLGRDDIGPDDDFFDSGGDSLLALELMLRLEQRHGLRPRLSVLFEARTPRALHAALGLGGGSPELSVDSAVVVRRGRADTNPLWLLPGGGGVPLVFEPLVSLLDPDLGVLGVEYPGTRGERPPCDTVEELGEHCHRVLMAAQSTGPYRLLGYSIGGLVAVDVARRLRDDGHEVEFLGAVAAGLGTVQDTRRFREKIADAWDTGGAGYVAERLRVQIGSRLHKGPERLRRRLRGWAEQQAIDRFGMRASDRLVFIHVRAASRAAGLRYRPPVIDAEVVLFVPDDTTDLQADVLTDGWRRVAGRGLRVMTVHGTHDDNALLVDPLQVRSLAAAVNEGLGSLR